VVSRPSMPGLDDYQAGSGDGLAGACITIAIRSLGQVELGLCARVCPLVSTSTGINRDCRRLSRTASIHAPDDPAPPLPAGQPRAYPASAQPLRRATRVQSVVDSPGKVGCGARCTAACPLLEDAHAGLDIA
jgi:ferredoxin